MNRKFYIFFFIFTVNSLYHLHLKGECGKTITSCSIDQDCQKLNSTPCSSDENCNKTNLACDADGTCNSKQITDLVCDTDTNMCIYDNKSCNTEKRLCIDDNLLFCDEGVCLNNICKTNSDCVDGAFCNEGICDTCENYFCDSVNKNLNADYDISDVECRTTSNSCLMTPKPSNDQLKTEKIICGNDKVNNCYNCYLTNDNKLKCCCPNASDVTQLACDIIQSTLDISTCQNNKVCNNNGVLECC